MSYSFTENIKLEIPNVEEQIANFTEGEQSKTKGLIIEVAAIHEGQTANHTHYSKEELEKAVESWVSPYPKPVILNHDPKSEPVGRVVAARMDAEEDGTAFTRLQLAITDPTAIEKVLSQRYLTGSVGGKADEAICSICNENWANASAFSAPCKHVRGKVYKGKVASLQMKNLQFKEYSWVNMPADGKSGVRAVAGVDGASEDIDDGDDWVRPARLFALSMDREEVMEYTESEQLDVLAPMTKKNASALHMQMKGAYLNALGLESTEEEEEDILAISESLSDSLSLSEEEVEEEEGEETEVSEEEEEVEEGTRGDGAAVTRDQDLHRPEGQEKPHKRDVGPERSEGAPLSRASDETPSEVTENSDEETELNTQESQDLAELQTSVTELQSQVEELEATNGTLVEENARLKAALKRGLVERVVDQKIALGITEKDNRADEIEEHLTRSASSLADSLRDLSTMAPVNNAVDYTKVPTVEENSNMAAAKGNDNEKVYVLGTELQESVNRDPEKVFTDVLMGRRKL